MENPVSREEFKSETDNIYGRLNKHDRQIAVLETLVENLKGLPSAINSLEKTMVLMGQNLESLNAKVDKIMSDTDEQDEKIDMLDDKSKVDLLDFLREKWWTIVSTAALILVLMKEYMIK